ncbi:hypothetical protein [Alkalihalobacterium chitinilyticum]|uniref:Uncharacterized protein n=1 Tax=Alkalihalobacterium chitinilyticum TaxID=2980103 RepID=A0ABT5VKF2_9BACI|nr:hypothetical protein [Alkalihalobacterium chitinilyticum]MDE5414913.1 hypothetical protein [Alkalihalobacterium chitinilyticum]
MLNEQTYRAAIQYKQEVIKKTYDEVHRKVSSEEKKQGTLFKRLVSFFAKRREIQVQKPCCNMTCCAA